MSEPRPLKPLPWPPLVSADRVPVSIRVRDTVLTWLAWLAFAWLLRDAALLLHDWSREPFGQLTYLEAPDWPVLWLRLRPFMQLAGLLAVWLGFWSLARRRALKAQASAGGQPAALDPALLCSQYSVSAPQLQAWQGSKVVTVDIDDSGCIVSVPSLETGTLTPANTAVPITPIAIAIHRKPE